MVAAHQIILKINILYILKVGNSDKNGVVPKGAGALSISAVACNCPVNFNEKLVNCGIVKKEYLQQIELVVIGFLCRSR